MYTAIKVVEKDYSMNTEMCALCGIIHKHEQSTVCPECQSKQFLRPNPNGGNNVLLPTSKNVWICSKCGYYEDSYYMR